MNVAERQSEGDAPRARQGTGARRKTHGHETEQDKGRDRCRDVVESQPMVLREADGRAREGRDREHEQNAVDRPQAPGTGLDLLAE